MIESFKEGLMQFLSYTGFVNCEWGHIIMITIGLIFIALAIIKEYEPLLLIPIGFGIILGNIPFTDGLQIGIYESGSVLNSVFRCFKRCLSAIDILGYRSHDRFFGVDFQPEVNLNWRSGTIGYLCCLYFRHVDWLFTYRSRLYRYYRWRRRSDSHLLIF